MPTLTRLFFLGGPALLCAFSALFEGRSMAAGYTNLGAFWRNASPPPAATGLVWSRTPVDANQLTATWTKSANSKVPIASQRIQLYSGATCTTALGSPVALSSIDDQSYLLDVTDGATYSFKIVTIGQNAGSSTSACSEAVTFYENFTVDGGTYTSASPYLAPASPILAVRNLTLQNSGYMTIGSDVIIANITLNTTSQLTINTTPTFVSMNVSSGTVTGKAFDNVIASGQWKTTPGAGNGKLIFTVTGPLTIGASGVIQMDGKGYQGGQTGSYNQGGSTTGPGVSTYSYAPNGGGGGGRNVNASLNYAGGGSYGTRGQGGGVSGYPGNTYGAADFWTKTYLGSGGGAGNGVAGGAGGGAISITANSLTFSGAGKITSKGLGTTAVSAGAGSGGTIVLNLSTFSNPSNVGTFDVSGGTGSGPSGGNGRVGMNLAPFFVSGNDYSFSNTGGQIAVEIPANTTVNNLTADTNSNVVLSAASGVTFSDTGTITIQNGGKLSLAQSLNVNNVTVSNGTLTAPAFSNNQDGNNNYTDTPSAGNGKLVLSARGTVSIGASGIVTMDATGYMGAGGARSSGASYNGPGNGTNYSANGGGGGGRNTNATGMFGAGGSYGTRGGYGSSTCCTQGAMYGQDDFESVLYLGSGGGSGNAATAVGGWGGGAISITAPTISVASGGQITSKGGAPTSSNYGAGSGGTVYLAATSSFTCSGTVSVAGGASGGSGGAGGSGRFAVALSTFSTGSGNYTVGATCGTQVTIPIAATDSVNTLTFDTSSNALLLARSGYSISTITIQNGGKLSLGQSLTVGAMNVTNGTLTAPGFSNSHAPGVNTAWLDNPAPGLGQLVLNVTGTLSVGASGKINMDGLGYAGGNNIGYISGASDASSTTTPVGTGTNSVANGGGGSGNGGNCTACRGGGASYGTVTTGPGGNGSTYSVYSNTYGADFSADKLYLGSGGGSQYLNKGGYGGGAISITATNVTITSGGTITAKGAAPGSYSGGGSGGTLIIAASGTFTAAASSAISIAGGSGSTGNGGSGRSSITYATCGGAYCP